KVEGLSKRYRIGAREHYRTFREAIIDAAAAPFRRLWRLGRPQDDPETTIWALKDVSFDVQQGEVLGIIGRNGAGKSTLLKILSRITEPTEGRARIRGRVASLLEVGTGFHPELTGRENTFLNGAILGMSRAEIARKFDEIVAFAELDKFIDTPVKRYSSGMYVRLAFAVAAHLEPEILLVDEVLAVGDAGFQKKCLGKMGSVAREGRTVLFVSHNMAAVENLCQRGVVLNQGSIRYIGSRQDAIREYLQGFSGQMSELRERRDRIGSGELRVVNIELRDAQGSPVDAAVAGQDLDVYLHFETAAEPCQCDVVGISLETDLGAPVFLHHNRLVRHNFGPLGARGAFVCRIRRLPLPSSTYRLSYSVMRDRGRTPIDSVAGAYSLVVEAGDYYGSGELPPASHGCCLVDASWRLE
ncbi:MAG: ABC transporter ATP-binding protein, partial [Planctomycetes bacterium]|nr:ABC transporter ATP-binding protein [Planctomycetota bacterium]